MTCGFVIFMEKLAEIPRRNSDTKFFGKGFIMLFSPKEKGQGLVEYAIIIVFVAILVIVILRLLGTNLGSTYSTISSSMP